MSSSQKIISTRIDGKIFGSFSHLLDFFFPKTCLSCDDALKSKDLICQKCFSQLSFVTSSDINEHFMEYFSNSKNVSGLFSLLNFEKDTPIQDLIHLLKYGNKPIVGNYLGNLFAEKYRNDLYELKISAIVPVPLYHSKKAERGYNQSYHFAKGISRILGIKINSSTVVRTRKTETQTHLTREERNKNVEKAFRIKSNSKLDGKNILVVDDVITTGSTINECTKIIKSAGAENIYAGSIALA